MFIDHYFFLVSSCSDACPLWSPSGVAKGAQIEENDCFSGANLLNIVKMGGGLLNKLNVAFFLGFHPLLKGFCLP
jgi:hypothetical protein